MHNEEDMGKERSNVLQAVLQAETQDDPIAGYSNGLSVLLVPNLLHESVEQNYSILR